MPKKVWKTFAEFRGNRFALKDDVERALHGEAENFRVYKRTGDEVRMSCNGMKVQIDPAAIVIDVI